MEKELSKSSLRNRDVNKWVDEEAFKWAIGDGTTALFWEDRWLSHASLRSLFPRLYRLANKKGVVVAEVLEVFQGSKAGWEVCFSRALLVSKIVQVENLQDLVGEDDWNFHLEDWWHNPASILGSSIQLPKAVWFPPNADWMKFNVGAAVLGPRVGCGGVLRVNLLVAIDLLATRIGVVEFKLVHRHCNALAFGLARDGALRDAFFKAWW
ncbi:hypothetical protein V6N12_006116 [Hibiscus sabdariffa]|uniref:Uncharacterized protein n=1 Tax=Hibiscus sabdariffa TaxID=183260 RepID=A0ABR2EY06_9ROSI